MVDHYRVLRPIGRGGMAEVYLARDAKLGRKVALKMIRADALRDDEEIRRFLFEARATARFNHPNIVTIYSVGETSRGPYVALEYLEGQTLRQRMDLEPPHIRTAMRLGLAIAEALHEAHDHDILHRDLKPENIMLGRDGRLRVLDFGLARFLRRGDDALARTLARDTIAGAGGEAPNQDDSSAHLTFESEGRDLCGTPAYMAPEQWAKQESLRVPTVVRLHLLPPAQAQSTPNSKQRKEVSGPSGSSIWFWLGSKSCGFCAEQSSSSVMKTTAR
jgi:serine/threonine protein kinase